MGGGRVRSTGLPTREQAIEWLTEPPPWPPASVAKYLGREGERAMALIETLAARSRAGAHRRGPGCCEAGWHRRGRLTRPFSPS